MCSLLVLRGFIYGLGEHVVPTSNFRASLHFRQRKTKTSESRSVELELDVDVTTYLLLSLNICPQKTLIKYILKYIIVYDT